jgi:hypothetical protein
MMLDVNQTFDKARGLHTAGRPAEAEPLYRQVLAVHHTHIDSLHLLGLAAHHLGRNNEALELIGKASRKRVASCLCASAQPGSNAAACRRAERVRAHVLLCMLAYYLEWHMRQALKPILFDDHDKAAADAVRTSIVAKAERSKAADHKAAKRHRLIGARPTMRS